MARQGRAFPGDPGHGCKHGRPAAFVVTIFFGDPTTVSNNTRKLRLRGIVAATSLALAGSAFAAQVQTAGLEPGKQFDRFVVKFKDDAPEAQNPAALRRSLEVASIGANQLIQASRLQRGDAVELLLRVADLRAERVAQALQALDLVAPGQLFGQLAIDKGALDGIGVVHRGMGVFGGQKTTLNAALFGQKQALACRCNLFGRHGKTSSATVLRRVPIPSALTSTTSPGVSQIGGSNRAPAPVGVPHRMVSPGTNVVKVEMYSTIR